jgi:hypothetical protein
VRAKAVQVTARGLMVGTICGLIGRWRVGVVLSFIVAGLPTIATAGMLMPSAYTSLGAQLSETGSYGVDTSAGIMTLPDGQTINGVISDGVAVFTFGSVNIDSATFTVVGANPMALLSQGNMLLTKVQMDLSASGSTPGPGGDLSPVGQGIGGFLSAAGGGGFGGAGGQGGSFVYTGSPGAPPAPWGYSMPGQSGGASYGGITGPIQGGSAGGSYQGLSPGGAGGGAVELGAGQTLGLTGVSIAANGGNGVNLGTGGGSGGGISLTGDAVNVDASSFLSAAGGAGGAGLSWGGEGGGMVGPGGDGGGGRIDIMGYQVNFLGSYDLSGGNPGVIEMASIPEPSSLVLAAMALLAGTVHAGSRRVRRHFRLSR